MKRKNGRGRGIESNRRLCASRRLSIFKNVALASLLAPIRRAPRLLDCVARITRRSRPPPIDIFHFLLHLSLENGTFRKGLKRMIFFIYQIPGYEDSVTCKKKKKKMAGISFYFVCEEYQQFFDFFESIVALFFQIFLILITFKKLLRKFLSNTRIGIWKY